MIYIGEDVMAQNSDSKEVAPTEPVEYQPQEIQSQELRLIKHRFPQNSWSSQMMTYDL